MKKRVKITAVILIIIAGFLLTSCEMIPTKKTEKKEATGMTGNQGLKISFVPNLPPPIVYSGESITIMLQAENKGTSMLSQTTNTKLFLSGFDNNIMNIKKPSTGEDIPDLEGRDVYRQQGDIQQISFQQSSGKKIELKTAEKYPTLILATACYAYTTNAGASVCIDPNPFTATRQPKICRPENIIMTQGQGAPIAVTKIELDPSRDKTRFRIHIKNIGDGTVFKDTQLEQCSPYEKGLDYTDIDVIKVESVKISTTELVKSKTGADKKCGPLDDKNYLRLANGEGILYCTLKTKEAGKPKAGFETTFTTPINIKLSYGYRDTAIKQIEIRKT